MKTLDDIKGRTLVTPDPDSITAWMVRAMLRGEKLGEKDLRVRTTRYQDAVPFYLDYDFADVGATAANAVVKSWTGKGGKVAVKSRSLPIKHIIASTKLSADEMERVREALIQLANTDAGRKVLAVTGYKGFEPRTPRSKPRRSRGWGSDVAVVRTKDGVRSASARMRLAATDVRVFRSARE